MRTIVLIAAAALLTGTLPMTGCAPHEHSRDAKKKVMLHCPMHPNFTSEKQRPCPICGMDLVPIEDEAPSSQTNAGVSGYTTVGISPERQQLIGVKKGRVEQRTLTKRIRAVGRVSSDPGLFNAQQEYITAKRHAGEMTEASPETAARARSLVDSARFKLKLAGLSDAQIESLGSAEADVSLINAAGQQNAWVYADIFEYDLAYVRTGQYAAVTIPSTGRELAGIIRSIDPVLNPDTRSAKARIYINNTFGLLRSEGYVNVSIAAPIGSVLAVPEDAVLDTGLRSIVFVDIGDGHFEPREVSLGEKVGAYYVVRSGIKLGDTVVTSANFLIDSESQLKAALKQMTDGHK